MKKTIYALIFSGLMLTLSSSSVAAGYDNWDDKDHHDYNKDAECQDYHTDNYDLNFWQYIQYFLTLFSSHHNMSYTNMNGYWYGNHDYDPDDNDCQNQRKDYKN